MHISVFKVIKSPTYVRAYCNDMHMCVHTVDNMHTVGIHLVYTACGVLLNLMAVQLDEHTKSSIHQLHVLRI